MNPLISILLTMTLPLIAAPFVYLAGRISVLRSKSGSAAPARWATLLVLLATGVFLFISAGIFFARGDTSFTIGAVEFKLDGISMLVSTVVLVLSAFVTLFSSAYMAGDEGEEKFFALLLSMTGSIVGLSFAGDLFNLWVWFEAMAISSYMLVAFYRDEPGSLEAGVKYLVQSAVGSIFVLLGIGLVYTAMGRLDLAGLRMLSTGSSPLLLAGGALMLIGFGVKSALVPLHTWLPDAHSQAPSGISAMLSGMVIEAGMIAMLRALGALSGTTAPWGALLLGMGALNMLVGNLMALRQTQVKRLLAYSSISNVGYILLGIGISISFHTADGATGGFFHLANHALMKGLAFLAAGALLYALHLSRHDHSPLVLSDLDGASRRYPLTAFAFSVALLALGGLPPLAGFMSKWQIFVAGFETHSAIIVLLVIFMALNSVLSLGYYAPLVNRMYRNQPSEIVANGGPISAAMGIPLVIMTLAIVAIGFWPSLLSWLTGPAARSLLAAFAGM
jgi:proton-translocating NADH-quinone oxidoreductase chain N